MIADRVGGALTPPRRPLGLKLRLLRVITTRLPRVKPLSFSVFSSLFQYMTKRGERRTTGMVAAHVRGFAVLLDPSDFVDAAILLFPQLYDYRELAFLRANLRPGETFLDIGAHLGLYALIASRITGESGRVLAVEADPTTYARLCHTVRVNRLRNVTPLNVGVSDVEGTLRFGLARPPLRAASSFLRTDSEGLDVPCQPLLTILREQGITSVGGMKLDIEGYEHRVLRRFLAEADRQLLPRFIITEFHADMVDKAGGDAIALLTSHGYQVSARMEVNCLLVRAAER